MGVNNRKRRAAKQRKRAKARTRGPTPPRAAREDHDGLGGYDDGLDERAIANSMVLASITQLWGDPAAAGEHAEMLAGHGRTISRPHIAEALDHWLADIVASVLRSGWTPSDLDQIVRRRGAVRHLRPLAVLLSAEADRHPGHRVSARWREELDGLGSAEAVDLSTMAGLETGLGLAAVLHGLPPITQILPPPGAAAPIRGSARPGADSKQLSRVRALLAKAESTEYADEAETLSAKAQELISRYALDRLVHEPAAESYDGDVTAVRLWIDAPYVLPKASLIDAVAGANRCRSVVTEKLGFSTVIGEASDLQAVEVMTTSLLVQAHTAMMGHGRHTDAWGTSRTRSFRRSFLMAYAARIGERLRAATQEAAAETGRGEVLLPALRRRAEHVDAACEEMFPGLVERATSISNGHGWAAGRAAADLARLDAGPNLTERAS